MEAWNPWPFPPLWHGFGKFILSFILFHLHASAPANTSPWFLPCTCADLPPLPSHGEVRMQGGRCFPSSHHHLRNLCKAASSSSSSLTCFLGHGVSPLTWDVCSSRSFSTSSWQYELATNEFVPVDVGGSAHFAEADGAMSKKNNLKTRKNAHEFHLQRERELERKRAAKRDRKQHAADNKVRVP